GRDGERHLDAARVQQLLEHAVRAAFVRGNVERELEGAVDGRWQLEAEPGRTLRIDLIRDLRPGRDRRDGIRRDHTSSLAGFFGLGLRSLHRVCTAGSKSDSLITIEPFSIPSGCTISTVASRPLGPVMAVLRVKSLLRLTAPPDSGRLGARGTSACDARGQLGPHEGAAVQDVVREARPLVLAAHFEPES